MHHGSCHCGAVRFNFNADVRELIRCDCSLCSKRNAVMGKIEERLFQITEGQSALSLYQWNTGRAQHYFFSKCGIYVFHRMSTLPTSFGVNAYCLDDFEPSSVPISKSSGSLIPLQPG